MYTLKKSDLKRLYGELEQMYTKVAEHTAKGQLDLLDEISELKLQVKTHRNGVKKVWCDRHELNDEVKDVLRHYQTYKNRLAKQDIAA